MEERNFMKTAIIVFALLVGGFGFGYLSYRWGVNRDGKRMAKLCANKGEDKRFCVKIRPVWKESDEDSDAVFSFELMASDAEEADFFARCYLDVRGRGLSYETISVTEVSKEI